MATSTYLSNPVVTINAVDLTDQATSAVFTRVIEALESTAFGSTSRVYTSGLSNNSLTVTLYNSYALTETLSQPLALPQLQTQSTPLPVRTWKRCHW